MRRHVSPIWSELGKGGQIFNFLQLPQVWDEAECCVCVGMACISLALIQYKGSEVNLSVNVYL